MNKLKGLQMKWDGMEHTLLALACFFWGGGGFGKAGRKNLHSTAILFSGKTEILKCRGTVQGEAGIPEVKKGSGKFPDSVPIVEWMCDQQSGTLIELGLDSGPSTIHPFSSFVKWVQWSGIPHST